MIRPAKLSLVLTLAAALSGCGGHSTKSSSSSTTVAPATSQAATGATIDGALAVAEVTSARVELYSIDPATRGLKIAAVAQVGSDGSFSLSASSAQGPALLMVRGGSYRDLASGQRVAFGDPAADPTGLDDPRERVLEVVLAEAAGAHTLNPSALTTIASRRALTLLADDPDALEPQQVERLHLDLAEELGLVVSGQAVDPRGLAPIAFVDTSNAAAIQARPFAPEASLGAILAGLSQEAIRLGLTDPRALVDLLAADFSDGAFDGAGPAAQAGESEELRLGADPFEPLAGTRELAESVAAFLDQNPRNASGEPSSTFSPLLARLATEDLPPRRNAPPRLDPLQDVGQPANAGTAYVQLDGLASGPASELNQAVDVISAAVSDPSVADVVVDRTSDQLQLVPRQPGATTVTVRVRDTGPTDRGGRNATTRSFTFTVGPPLAINNAPSFAAIPDQALLEDAAPLALTIDNVSANDPNQTLSFTVSSSDPALIPTPGLSGSGATRTLTLAPVADQFGSATITVTVQDNGGTALTGVDSYSQDFVVTVASVNDEPTFTAPASQTILTNAGPTTLQVSGISAGPANESQTLVLSAASSDTSLLPTPTVQLNGATADLILTPAANAKGSVDVTLTLDDPDGTANGGDDSFRAVFSLTLNDGRADLTAIKPALASADGGTEISIATSGFAEDFTQTPPTVRIGGQPATVVATPSPTTVVVSAPALSAGTVSVEVNTPTSTGSLGGFEVVPPAGAGDLLLNEYFADPSQGSVSFDANGDGAGDSSEDEFVELINTRSTPLDLSGLRLRDGIAERHVFANPTTLPPGGAIVVFGGGTPTGFAPVHSGGQAQTASGGLLGLNNGGDTIEVLGAAPSTTVILSHTYSSSPDGLSSTREVDLDGAASFVEHGQAGTQSGVNDALGLASPGKRVDGSDFPASGAAPAPNPTPNPNPTPTPNPNPTVTISAVVPSAASSAGGTELTVRASGFSSSFLVSAPGATIGQVPAGAVVVDDTTLTITVPPGLSVGATTLELTQASEVAQAPFEILAPLAPAELVINEFMADPNDRNGAGNLDVNGDGSASATEDEFVELVNTRATALDLSGAVLQDGVTTRHVFPNPTLVPAGGSIVVFGGGNPLGFAALHESGHAQVASSNALGLNNGGDTIEVLDPAGTSVSRVTYSSSTGGKSSTRAVEGDPNAAFVEHDQVTGAVGGLSPGRKVDGQSFR